MVPVRALPVVPAGNPKLAVLAALKKLASKLDFMVLVNCKLFCQGEVQIRKGRGMVVDEACRARPVPISSWR